jgi:hypothetical protein
VEAMKILNKLRWQEIKHSVKRGAYVTYKGDRLYLDMFMRGKLDGIDNVCSIYGLSAFSCYGIELTSCGGMARVYYIVL